MKNKIKQTILIDIPCTTTMKSLLSASDCAVNRLLEEDLEVVLLVPEFAYEFLKSKYPEATVVPIGDCTQKSKLQKLSEFITKNLNLTPMQVLSSKYGIRPGAPKDLKKSYLHGLRVLIAHTLGKWSWFRLRVAPFIHLYVYKEQPLKEIFDTYNPDLVFVPNMSNSQGEEVLREVKRQNLPSIGMVGSWDHPHKRYQALKTDKVFVWSEVLKEEMVTMQSYKGEDVLVVGAPHYDMFCQKNLIASRDELFAELGLDPQKKLISFYSGTGRSPDDGDLVDMMVKWNAEGKLSEPVQFYVRTYPGDRIGDHAKFDQFESFENVYIDWLEGSYDFGEHTGNIFPDETFMKRLISVYFHSEMVVSAYSSVSVEASIFSKPSLNIQFDGYKDRKFSESLKRFIYQSHCYKLFETNGIIRVNSPEEFLSEINNVLTTPGYNVENIKKMRDKICGELDGGVSKRMVEHILRMLHSN